MTNGRRNLQLLKNITFGFAQAKFNSEKAIKLEDIYGIWGMSYAFEVGIYFWPVPPIVTAIMIVIFKRKNLLGVTQKFIISIMVTNLCYITISVVRDTILKVFEMHYGFLDYHVCAEVIISLRIQMIIHTSSLWISNLMTLHQLLMIGFPLKVKLCNLSAYFCAFIFVHLLLSTAFLLILTFPSFEPVPLIQEYKPGYPLRKTMGCAPLPEVFADLFIEAGFGADAYRYITVLYIQVIPFSLHLIMIMALVVLLIKQTRSLLLLTNHISLSQVKYVILMKVNIGLGLSLLLQELPVTVIMLLQFSYRDVAKWENYLYIQGLSTSVLSVSYFIGKPMDLLIYASLSSTFKEELKYLVFGRRGPSNGKLQSRSKGHIRCKI